MKNYNWNILKAILGISGMFVLGIDKAKR
ncbi:hypothetical protein Q604_UNBC09402G0001, partial [human gut metagenome]